MQVLLETVGKAMDPSLTGGHLKESSQTGHLVFAAALLGH